MTTPLQPAEKVGYQANGAPWGPSLLIATALTGMLATILAGHGYLAGLCLLMFIPIWYTEDQSKLKYGRIETCTRTSYTVIFFVTLVIWFFTVIWHILTEPETDTWSNIAILISSFGALTMAARFAMPWIHKSKPVIPHNR